MGENLIVSQDVSRRDILYPMRGALVVALTLTLWSYARCQRGKYSLVEKYNWGGKIDGQGEKNPPLQNVAPPLIASRSGAVELPQSRIIDGQGENSPPIQIPPLIASRSAAVELSQSRIIDGQGENNPP